jgi:hypothetical protein
MSSKVRSVCHQLMACSLICILTLSVAPASRSMQLKEGFILSTSMRMCTIGGLLSCESTACSFASCALTSCSCRTFCLKNSLVFMPKLQLSLTTYVHVARVQILIQQRQLRALPLSQGITQYAVIPTHTLERRILFFSIFKNSIFLYPDILMNAPHWMHVQVMVQSHPSTIQAHKVQNSRDVEFHTRKCKIASFGSFPL